MIAWLWRMAFVIWWGLMALATLGTVELACMVILRLFSDEFSERNSGE